MTTWYTRTDAANIVTGNTIEAAHINNECNAIATAFTNSFNGTSGHSHDGTTGEGPKIDVTTSITGIVPVANGGTGASTLTANGVVLANGTSALAATTALTNGQIVVGRTGLAPIPATISASNGVAVTNGSGSIAIAGTDATTSAKGVASFTSSDFSVTSGAVSLATTVVKTSTSPNFTNVTVADEIIHDGDTDTKLTFGADTLTVTIGNVNSLAFSATEVVVNEGGDNLDFRVETDNVSDAFVVDASTDDASFNIPVRARPDVVTVSGTSKTLALTDANTIQSCSNAGTQTITVPANADVAFPTDTIIGFIQAGAGSVIIDGDTGVTVNGTSGGSVTITGQYQAATLLKTATNTWICFGSVV